MVCLWRYNDEFMCHLYSKPNAFCQSHGALKEDVNLNKFRTPSNKIFAFLTCE